MPDIRRRRKLIVVTRFVGLAVIAGLTVGVFFALHIANRPRGIGRNVQGLFDEAETWRAYGDGAVQTLAALRVKYEKVLRAAPETSWAQEALLRLAQIERRAGNPRRALSYLDRLVNGYPEGNLAAQGRYTMGRIWQKEIGDPDRALTSYRIVVNTYLGALDGNESGAPDTAHRLMGSPVLRAVVLNSLVAGASIEVQQGEFASAVKTIEAAREKFTQSPAADLLMMWEADLRADHLANDMGARSLWAQLLSKRPNSPWSAVAEGRLESARGAKHPGPPTGGPASTGRMDASEIDLSPTWSPQGFYFAFKRRDSIYVADSSTAKATRLYSAAEDGDVSPPSWAPEGSNILFTSLRGQGAADIAQYAVVVVDSRTGKARELATGQLERDIALSGGAAQWLARGRRVAFVAKEGDEHALKICGFGDATPQEIARVRGLCTFSASARSDLLAYGFAIAADRGGVIVIDASAPEQERRPLWEVEMRPARGVAERARSLVWSPAGDKLVAAVIAPGSAAPGESAFLRKLVAWDSNDGGRTELLSTRSQVEILWRADAEAVWVLCRRQPWPVDGPTAVLLEISLDGAIRVVADGDIVHLAKGGASAASAAYVLRDGRAAPILGDEHGSDEPAEYRLVALLDGRTPMEITSHAVWPAWSGEGDKIAFHTSARTLGGLPVNALGLAFVPSARVEYLPFSFEERLWQADQFYQSHNHGNAKRVYEKLLASVAEEHRTALEMRTWLARKRISGGEADEAVIGRMQTHPAECHKAVEAFAALGEYDTGIDFFVRLRQAWEEIGERAALHAELAIFDLYWRSGFFDLAEKVMIRRIVPSYRRILDDAKTRQAPVKYEPGVAVRLGQLIRMFPDRVRGRYAGADPIGLVTEIKGVYGEDAGVRGALELKATVYALQGDGAKALNVWIALLAGADDAEERGRVWERVLDLELDMKVQ